MKTGSDSAGGTAGGDAPATGKATVSVAGANGMGGTGGGDADDTVSDSGGGAASVPGTKGADAEEDMLEGRRGRARGCQGTRGGAKTE